MRSVRVADVYAEEYVFVSGSMNGMGLQALLDNNGACCIIHYLLPGVHGLEAMLHWRCKRLEGLDGTRIMHWSLARTCVTVSLAAQHPRRHAAGKPFHAFLTGWRGGASPRSDSGEVVCLRRQVERRDFAWISMRNITFALPRNYAMVF